MNDFYQDFAHEINTLRPESSKRKFADAFLKYMVEVIILWLICQAISLVDKTSALLHVMAYHRICDKPIPESLMAISTRLCHTELMSNPWATQLGTNHLRLSK